MKHQWQQQRLASLFLALATISGCGSRMGDISGTVSFNGEPLPSGRIAFYCNGGDKPVLMSPIEAGTYTITGAPLGPSRVTIETFEMKTTPVPEMIGSPQPPDQPATTTAGKEYVRLPVRYASAETSELTHEILAGTNLKDFDLNP